MSDLELAVFLVEDELKDVASRVESLNLLLPVGPPIRQLGAHGLKEVAEVDQRRRVRSSGSLAVDAEESVVASEHAAEVGGGDKAGVVRCGEGVAVEGGAREKREERF